MTTVSPNLLPRIKQLLQQSGFYDPGFLQIIKQGQIFGLVRELNSRLEMHVRGFVNGKLDAEIEISRKYLEHLNPNASRPAQVELEQLLAQAGIPFEPAPPDTKPERIVLPDRLTDWRLLAANVVVGVTVIGIVAAVTSAVMSRG